MQHFQQFLDLIQSGDYATAIPLMQSQKITSDMFISEYIKAAYPQEINFELFKNVRPNGSVRESHAGQKYEQKYMCLYDKHSANFCIYGWYKSTATNINIEIKPLFKINAWFYYEPHLKISCEYVNKNVEKRLKKSFFESLKQLKNDLIKNFEKITKNIKWIS